MGFGLLWFDHVVLVRIPAMNLESLVMLLVGLGVSAAGIAIVVFRKSVAERNRRNIEQKFGKLFPGFADGSTPERMIPVGIGGILVGLLIIAKALLW